jgi:hypothetical protein
MAKQSGLGSSFFVGVYDISGDVGAITSAETMRGELDVTGIDKSAMERITTLRDGTLSFASFWNTTASTGTVAVGYGMGLEWGEMLTTGKQSFATGTVNGTAIDLGSASTLFGAAAYLHVFSVASGTATFAVQDSTDNVTFNNITGLAFTGATGATTQRLQTASGATVLRYVRVQGTGVHGAAVIALNFIRYTESVVS